MQQTERSRLVFGQPIPDDPFIGGQATRYDQFARSQENRSWYTLERLVLEHILKNYPRDIPILEIGIGAGNLTSLLLEMGFDDTRICAVEPNITLLKLYAHRYPNIETHVAYMNELTKFFDKKFSLILAHMVINHIPTQELVESLRGAFVSLTDGGEFICVMPNPLEKEVKYNLSDHDSHAVVAEVAPWGGYVKYHHRSEEQLLLAFRNAGFTQVDVMFRPMISDPFNKNNDFQRITSPYFLKEHPLYTGLPTRLVIRVRK